MTSIRPPASPLFIRSRRREESEWCQRNVPQDREEHQHRREDQDRARPDRWQRHRPTRRPARQLPRELEGEKRQRKHEQRVVAQRRARMAVQEFVDRALGSAAGTIPAGQPVKKANGIKSSTAWDQTKTTPPGWRGHRRPLISPAPAPATDQSLLPGGRISGEEVQHWGSYSSASK